LGFSIPETADPGQWADAYSKIASEYPGTLAGQRACLQDGAALLAAGEFADAQAQFQKFLDAHPDENFSAPAALGVAASLEASGKLDLATGAYQRVINGFSDVVTANAARFALARIAEQQGRFTDALNFFETISRSSPPGSASASEAAMRVVELRTKLATAMSAAGKP
jgi:predicted negative regulator of RcsB-dependent stress response